MKHRHSHSLKIAASALALVLCAALFAFLYEQARAPALAEAQTSSAAVEQKAEEPKKETTANNAAPKKEEKQNETAEIEVPEADVGRDKALALALKHAGLEKETVHDVDVDADREQKKAVYEVSFEKDGVEYDYVISAETGEILSHKKEEEPKKQPVTASAVQQPEAEQNVEEPANETPVEPPKPKTVTREAAVSAALKAVFLKQHEVRELEVERDVERGKAVFEVSFEAGRVEFDVTVSAETGKVLRVESDAED
ncbi:MAG: PepSY domain-containing protein [Clostridia bacterium]|nr:PepSY domain-containing protein [Clostridia bacterium]